MAAAPRPSGISELFVNNRSWAADAVRRDPEFFSRLTHQQTPRYFWIGCSDSRVPANEIVGLLPGEMFVHRNVANVVVHTDLNCLSTLQYAVDVLKVEHIIVCGHYGCGGIAAALKNRRLGLIDNWLRHVQDVRERYAARVNRSRRPWDLLCELNVVEQVGNVLQTTIVQDARRRGQPLTVHGVIYDLRDGLLRPLTESPRRR